MEFFVGKEFVVFVWIYELRWNSSIFKKYYDVFDWDVIIE